MPEDKEDKIIDLPTDGPGAEVTLPEEPVKEGSQPVDIPEKKPEGEVEIKETPPVEEKPSELITEKKEEATKEEGVKQETKSRISHGFIFTEPFVLFCPFCCSCIRFW